MCLCLDVYGCGFVCVCLCQWGGQETTGDGAGQGKLGREDSVARHTGYIVRLAREKPF